MRKKDIEKQIAKSGWASLTQKQKDYYYSTVESPNDGKKGISEIIYDEACRCLGRDISPRENEYGCQESCNVLLYFATGEALCNSLSTFIGYQTMKSSKRFKEIKEPDIKRGDIIISPTSTSKLKGKALKVKNGHIGIIGDMLVDNRDIKIMSNSSNTSLWTQNYLLSSWKKRWGNAGYPVLFYRCLW